MSVIADPVTDTVQGNVAISRILTLSRLSGTGLEPGAVCVLETRAAVARATDFAGVAVVCIYTRLVADVSSAHSGTNAINIGRTDTSLVAFAHVDITNLVTWAVVIPGARGALNATTVFTDLTVGTGLIARASCYTAFINADLAADAVVVRLTTRVGNASTI